MVQTNLREIDMADIDAVVFAQELKEFGATVVNLNAAGIIASYDTKLAYQPRSQYLTGDSLLQMCIRDRSKACLDNRQTGSLHRL